MTLEGYFVVSEKHKTANAAWHDWLQVFSRLIRTIPEKHSLYWRHEPELIKEHDFTEHEPHFIVTARITVELKT